MTTTGKPQSIVTKIRTAALIVVTGIATGLLAGNLHLPNFDLARIPIHPSGTGESAAAQPPAPEPRNHHQPQLHILGGPHPTPNHRSL